MSFRSNASIRVLCFVMVALLPSLSSAQASLKSSRSTKSPEVRSPLEALDQHYQAARTFSIGGDSDRAAVEYRAFLAEALRQMANLRANESNYDSALQLFNQAVSIAPNSPEIRRDYANTLFLHGDLDHALIQAQKAVEFQSESAQSQYLLGRVFYEKSDYKQAKEHLEAAAKASGGSITFAVGYDLALTYLKLEDVNRASVVFDEMMIGLGNTARLHIYFGHAYLITGHYDRAISEFKEALHKDPKVKEAHYLLGLSYLSRDEGNGWEENAAEDRAEIQNNPDDFRPHYDLGNVALKLHHVEEAELELKRAAAIQPDNPDPLIALGELYISERKLPEADAAMSKAISITKDPSRNQYQVNRAYYVLGRIQVEAGHREEGVQNLKMAAELREKSQAPQQSRDESKRVAEQRRASEKPVRESDNPSTLPPDEQRSLNAYFAELKPAIADAYNNMGVAAAAHKDFDTAVVDFRQAGEWYPALETLDRNLGMAAFYAGNYQESISPLYHVIERNPDDQRARTALGLSYFAVQNYQATIETLHPIEPTVTSDPGAGSAYAVSLIKTGNYEDGMARLKALEQANPNVAGLHTTIGETYADQGIYATAIDEYKKSLALDSSQGRTHFLLGTALLRQGKPADAGPEFRAALAGNPTDSVAKYDLALSLLQTQQKDEALPLFQQVVQQDPNYADAYYQLGKLQLESGNTKQSISNLETAANLSPSSDYIHYQLSLAYGRDARSDDAKREMETYQALKTQRRGDHEQPQSN
ncbi:MAG TPA: tetratricopeptide repeat protein [Terriglobales bacterium]|jgi:tetratricopeptide (TPR) repeat protein|nr:tetratricopeptide repeat protein [Terriglobales bacterium]